MESFKPIQGLGQQINPDPGIIQSGQRPGLSGDRE
jgi:hypothetical protein